MLTNRIAAARLPIGCLILLGVWAPGAGANEGDVLRPLVAYGYTHEDNLFRLPGGLTGIQQQLAAPNGKSDHYQTLTAGLNLDWKQARQRVLVNAVANQTRFSRYSILDYDGRDITGEWQWQLGNRLRGNLGMTYQRSLGSYQDIGINNKLVSNVRTRTNHHFTADYRFHPSWEAEARFRRQGNEYSVSSLANSNYTQDEVAVGGYYNGGMIERLGLELSGIQGDFPDRAVASGLSRSYQGYALNLVANGLVTGKSRLRARVGYLSRRYDGLATPDYSGVKGRVDWDWTPSGKTSLNLAVYRELQNTELAGTTQQTADGVSASAQWQPKAKLVLGLSARAEDLKYDGSSLNDRISSVGASASYTPWRDSSVTVSAQRQSRSSNGALRDFDATVVAVNLQIRF